HGHPAEPAAAGGKVPESGIEVGSGSADDKCPAAGVEAVRGSAVGALAASALLPRAAAPVTASVPMGHRVKGWAVVPVKALSASKQRLALALGGRRENFARAMLVQTLFALSGARRVAGTLVVTSDPDVAEEARRAGAEVLQAEADLNAACSLGLAEVR